MIFDDGLPVQRLLMNRYPRSKKRQAVHHLSIFLQQHPPVMGPIVFVLLHKKVRFCIRTPDQADTILFVLLFFLSKLNMSPALIFLYALTYSGAEVCIPTAGKVLMLHNLVLLGSQ